MDDENVLLETVTCPADLCTGVDASVPSPSASGLDAGVTAEAADAARMPAIPEPLILSSVVANGTGCPPDSWATSISSDGRSFKTTFSSYELNINNQTPEQTITRNCLLSVNLSSPENVQYAVTSFQLSGYAFLEQGVTLTTTGRTSFLGAPVPPGNPSRVNLTGPYDQDFVFKFDVKASDAVWSPCGLERNLNIFSTLQLRNSSPKRSGYANLAAFDGSTALTFALAVRRCSGGLPPPILPGTTGAVPRP